MSEYQYVAFRAIDAPLSKQNLEFMRKQSTRALITSWSFENEYHYGDFRGNAAEMLRRGYDLHLHATNWAVRRVMIRLPRGLPDPQVNAEYLDDESLVFLKDKDGPGGILDIDPHYESGDVEDWMDWTTIFRRLAPLRAEILEGDLRPWYLAHLAVAFDAYHDSDETIEALTPAGLDNLTKAQQAFADFMGLDKHLLAAAAKNAPSMNEQTAPTARYEAWLAKQPDEAKNAWLARLMTDEPSSVRAEMMAAYHATTEAPTWPTARLNRTLAELVVSAKEVEKEAKQRARKRAQQKREKRLAEMAADPQAVLEETNRLVKTRTGDAYEKAASLLADLRDALVGTAQANLAQEHFIKLRSRNPTLHKLGARLKAQGFVLR